MVSRGGSGARCLGLMLVRVAVARIVLPRAGVVGPSSHRARPFLVGARQEGNFQWLQLRRSRRKLTRLWIRGQGMGWPQFMIDDVMLLLRTPT